MRLRRFAQITLLLIVALAFAQEAFAKDAIRAGVSVPAGEPQPVMTENGNGYTPGTYAIGTIILNYTFVGTSFPVGPFGTFNLNLAVYDAGGRNDPTCPVALSLGDIGSPHLTLSPAASPISVTGLAWSGSVPVTIIIPASVAGDESLNEDGDQLVGHLRLSTPGGAFLDTVTDVLVKITLVHPSACLKVYEFITDATLVNTIESTQVNVNPQGKVTSTNPYGSLSNNVLIANTCSLAETFDLGMLLDSRFSTQPSNNPGNAVFTFSTSGEIDPSTFDIGAFGTGTAQGQNLCLQNVAIAPGSTFLAKVHVAITKGLLATALPAGGVFDGFSAALTEAGSGCTGGLVPIANPNPVSAPLTFTIR